MKRWLDNCITGPIGLKNYLELGDRSDLERSEVVFGE